MLFSNVDNRIYDFTAQNNSTRDAVEYCIGLNDNEKIADINTIVVSY